MNQKELGLFISLCCYLGVGFSQYTETDWSARDQWMDVTKILEWAEVEPGDIVADVGCHEGYLSIHLARRVGAAGKVYSVDVVRDHLNVLEKHADERNLSNIITILGANDDPHLPEKSLDVIFIMDAYHEMDEHKAILQQVKNDLKPGGRIVILEKLKDHARDKSRKAQADAHTLSPEFVKAELEEAGFTISRELRNLGNWENEKDKKIWLLIGVVPES